MWFWDKRKLARANDIKHYFVESSILRYRDIVEYFVEYELDENQRIVLLSCCFAQGVVFAKMLLAQKMSRNIAINIVDEIKNEVTRMFGSEESNAVDRFVGQITKIERNMPNFPNISKFMIDEVLGYQAFDAVLHVQVSCMLPIWMSNAAKLVASVKVTLL